MSRHREGRMNSSRIKGRRKRRRTRRRRMPMTLPRRSLQ
jgi:hypothetical protein